MNPDYASLAPHEHEYLMDALRRDLRHSQESTLTDHANSKWHAMHARQTEQLLEALQPKSETRCSITREPLPAPAPQPDALQELLTLTATRISELTATLTGPATATAPSDS